MGLNDSFNNTRSELLLMNPLPSISRVFSIMIEEKCQKSIYVASSSPGHMLTWLLDLTNPRRLALNSERRIALCALIATFQVTLLTNVSNYVAILRVTNQSLAFPNLELLVKLLFILNLKLESLLLNHLMPQLLSMKSFRIWVLLNVNSWWAISPLNFNLVLLKHLF